MSFANPSMLYFLLFALVPILLYFFNLQKLTHVEFSNVELLEDLKKQTSNRFQLKRLLIMLARVLAIIFIVLAFAQPSFKQLDKEVNQHHIVFLDNSLSMTRKVDAVLLLDKAKAMISSVIKARKGDKFSFITHKDLEINRDYYSKKEFLKAISELTPSTGTFSHQQIADVLRRKDSDLAKKYYYVSDFQTSSFDIENFEKSIDKDDQLVLCNLTTDEGNCYIDSIWVESKYLVVGNTVKVSFRLVNNSKSEKEILVKCLVEGDQLGTKVEKVEANSSKTSQIEFQLTKKGFNSLVLRIDDSSVEFDNDYFFVLEANRNINVLIVKGVEKSNFDIAYKNEALFLTKVFEESRLNSSELSNNDLIILDQVKRLNNLPVEQLKEFVAQGGDLTIVPNADFDEEDIKTFLSKVGSLASISKVNQVEKEDLDFTAALKHPWFKTQFQSTDLKVQSVNFQSSLVINGAESILKSRKGTPFLSMLNTKNSGSIYLFSTNLGEAKTNFLKHSLFVVNAYEMAMNSASINRNISFDIGSEEIVLKEVRADKSNQYKLISSKNQYTPQQQIVGNNLILSLEKNEDAGVYDVQAQKEVLTKLGLNFSRKESNFEALDLSSLNNNDNIEVQNWDASQSYLADDANVGFGKWKLWVLLALICLLAETALIRFYK